MLRSIGLLLVVASAVGIIAVLQTFFEYGGFEFRLGSALALSFAGSGLAVGVMLLRKVPPKRGAIFWIAIFGVTRGALLAIPIGIGIALVLLQQINSLGLTWFSNWWPPKEALFHNTLWFTFYTGSTGPYEVELFYTTSSIAGIFVSPIFWFLVPLGLYLWVLWGRAGGLADKVLGYVALALAILMTISAIETGLVHYSMATYEPPPDTIVDFLYYPKLHWYVLYAIEVLLFTATAVLLLRRQPRIKTRNADDRA